MRKVMGPGAALWTAAALLALPAVANAAEVFRPHVATGWSAHLPDAWKLALKQKLSAEAHFGKHTFHSPNKNGQLKVTIRRDNGGKFAELIAANHAKLIARLTDPKVVAEGKDVEADKEVSFKVVTGKMLRTNFMRDFTIGRVFIRDLKHKRLLTLTLAMSHEKIEKFNEIFEKLMTTFELIDPKPLAPSNPKAPALKPAGHKA